MNFRKQIPLCLAALAALFLPSCSIIQKSGAGLAAYQSYDRPAVSPTNPDDVKVKVSLSRQRTYVMEGDRVLMVMPVSVGAPGTATPPGNFRIQAKDAKRREPSRGYAHKGDSFRLVNINRKPPGWKFTGTPMPYWCEFKKGYGFHTGWIRHYPCTDGCIRMHENLAPKFFAMVKIGTPVSIAYSQPEDATHGKIPLPPDAGPLPDYGGEMYVTDGYFKHHKTPVFE